LMQRR